MIETLSRKLTDQEIVFWKSHLDRDFIANTLFPAIGDHFRSSNNEVRLLDIGVQSYNRAHFNSIPHSNTSLRLNRT